MISSGQSFWKHEESVDQRERCQGDTIHRHHKNGGMWGDKSGSHCECLLPNSRSQIADSDFHRTSEAPDVKLVWSWDIHGWAARSIDLILFSRKKLFTCESLAKIHKFAFSIRSQETTASRLCQIANRNPRIEGLPNNAYCGAWSYVGLWDECATSISQQNAKY
jgi:hypothetical protein